MSPETRAIYLRNDAIRLDCAISAAKQPPSWMDPDKPTLDDLPELQADLAHTLAELSEITGQLETVDTVRWEAIRQVSRQDAARDPDRQEPIDVWEDEAMKERGC